MALRRTVIGLVLGTLLSLTPAAQFIQPASASAYSDEMSFVARINSLRASHGLGALTVDSTLTATARRWAQSMANAGAISHNPSLSSQVGSNWIKVGENVGVGGNVGVLMTAFINSPSHYHNLIDPGFNRIGVGVVWKGNSMYTTHDFMQTSGAPAAAPPPPPAPTYVAPAPSPHPTQAATSGSNSSAGNDNSDSNSDAKEADDPMKFERTMSSLRGIRHELRGIS